MINFLHVFRIAISANIFGVIKLDAGVHFSGLVGEGGWGGGRPAQYPKNQLQRSFDTGFHTEKFESLLILSDLGLGGKF